jgi:hypothetical protein
VLALRAKGKTMFARITLPIAALGTVCIGTSVTMAETQPGESLRDSTRNNGHVTLNGAPGGPVFAHGLLHEPLGDAVVSGQGGSLVVSNIGSSGNDGVDTNLPLMRGMTMDIGGLPDLTPGTFYVDSFFDITFRIDFNNDPTGTNTELLSLDQPGMCDNSQLLIETFLDGQTVDSAVVPNPLSGQPLVVTNIGSTGKDGVPRITLSGGDSQFAVDSFFDITFAVDPDGHIVGNPPAGPINQVRITQFACDCLPLDCDPLNPAAGLRAADIPELTVTRATIRPFVVDSFFDIAYDCVSLGDAHYAPGVDEGLVMDNLGSSGKDGVEVSIAAAGGPCGPCSFALGGTRSAVDGTLYVDSFFDITYQIDFAGGSGTLSYVGPCDASSSSETLVELTLDGQVVASELFPPGASGQPLVSSNLGSSGKDDNLPMNLGTLGDQFQVDSFFDIAWEVVDPQARILNGSAPVAANGARITVLDCPGNSPQPSEVIRLRATTPTLRVRSVQVISPPALPCPADCAPDNGDGTFGNAVINIDDLLSVINRFGDAGGPCDNAPDNGDGTFGNNLVNIDDLLGVINAFGDCP